MATINQDPLMKEFDVVWYNAEVWANGAQSLTKRHFFKHSEGVNAKSEVILPEGIEYSDLLAFVGKKTRVTIEVLPW